MTIKRELNALSLSNKVETAIKICTECEELINGSNGFKGFVVFKNGIEVSASITHFEYEEDIIYLCFLSYSQDKEKDDDYSEIEFKIVNIKNIIFDGEDEMRIIIIELHNGDTVIINCMM